MKEPVTRLDYCQYLLVSQINYTLTNFADHCEQFSHDAINRYLRDERITPRLVWENVRTQVVPSVQGYLVFDDTVLDKHSSNQIELVRRQYSGNAKAVIKGIGVVTCVYVHPERDQFWLIDYPPIRSRRGRQKQAGARARDAGECCLSKATAVSGGADGHLVCD